MGPGSLMELDHDQHNEAATNTLMDDFLVSWGLFDREWCVDQ